MCINDIPGAACGRRAARSTTNAWTVIPDHSGDSSRHSTRLLKCPIQQLWKNHCMKPGRLLWSSKKQWLLRDLSKLITSYISLVSDLPHSYKNHDKTKHLFEIFNFLNANTNKQKNYAKNIMETIDKLVMYIETFKKYYISQWNVYFWI